MMALLFRCCCCSSILAVVVLLLLACPPAVVSGLSSSATRMPPLASKVSEHLPLAKKAMAYFDSSPDPFHAVQSSIDLLEEAGFVGLDGDSGSQLCAGKIVPGGKYFYTRNKSTLVAFAVGEKYDASGGGGGFKVIGGHTDSPNLRVKPRSKRSSNGSVQIGVECYGGGLWHTWFDRDLGVSGRVLVRTPDNGKIQQRLVKLDRAILRVSNLAIHLQTASEREAFKVNKEDHLSPILATEAQKALSTTTTTSGGSIDSESSKEDDGNDDDKETKREDDGWCEYQEPLLLQLLAAELGVQVEDIADFELSLFDVQKAALGGAFSEFIHSARLDNLASCFLAVRALLDYCGSGEDLVAEDKDVSMIVLYDHEEVGSESAVGAASPILSEAVRTISLALNNNDNNKNNLVYENAISKSFVLSVDQAHAVHPNYASKHEKTHQPKMNGGMVIKRNCNQRYATNAITGLLIREICRRAGLKPVPQEFIVRQDCGCGSTIGPIISTVTGIRAIDMGCPQLSMHSIRETMGVCDLTNGLDLFKAFFRYFREVDSSVEQ